MRDIIIERVPEDTPLPIIRKSEMAKKRDRLEYAFLKRQEKHFLKIAGNITFTSQEWFKIAKRGYGSARW